MTEKFVDSYGTPLVGVHSRERCQPPCVIHAPSDHHMRSWPLLWRFEHGIFERICQHGIGHPDPDGWYPDGSAHGCCGCCREPFPLPPVDADGMW